MIKRKISMFGFSLAILFTMFFLSGCSPKPFLTQDGTYVVLTVSPSGMTQSELVELPWNTNTAVLQNFLLECSFVLSDLQTPPAASATAEPGEATRIQAAFPQPKRMKFVVDDQALTLDVQSIQIEIEGAHVGQVTLNQTLVLQGLNNPNLKPAFQELMNALHNKDTQ